jgi:hypothetical protein
MKLQDFFLLSTNLWFFLSGADTSPPKENLQLFDNNFGIRHQENFFAGKQKDVTEQEDITDNKLEDFFHNDDEVEVVTSQYGRREFDWKLGNTSVWLCAAAYCSTDTLLTREYVGYSEGFVPTDVIKTEHYGIDGFVGYHSSQSRIYVVFRGTSTAHDLTGDLDTTLVTYPSCNNCKVHEGFYNAELSIFLSLVDIVLRLLKDFPSYEVVVTGHSLGGALATLVAMDLVHVRLDSRTKGDSSYVLLSSSSSSDFSAAKTLPVTLITFGSPKIGNIELAYYASKLLLSLHYRVTHLRDIVPHLPLFMGYTQTEGEYYEDENGKVHPCDGFEDLSCSNKWFILSIEDHFRYLGMPMTCASVSKISYHPIF